MRWLDRVDICRGLLTAYVKQLLADDAVIVKANGNASAFMTVLASHVKKVVIADPMQVRMITRAKI